MSDAFGEAMREEIYADLRQLIADYSDDERGVIALMPFAASLDQLFHEKYGFPLPDGETGPPWSGWRITLNCGHLELTDLESRHIGKLVACNMCPLTVHHRDTPGSPVAQVRVIVDRQPVEAPQEPGSIPSAYWYGT